MPIPPAPYSLQWNMFYSNDLNRISFLSKITALFGFLAFTCIAQKGQKAITDTPTYYGIHLIVIHVP